MVTENRMKIAFCKFGFGFSDYLQYVMYFLNWRMAVIHPGFTQDMSSGPEKRKTFFLKNLIDCLSVWCFTDHPC